jgi:hypothetical protein
MGLSIRQSHCIARTRKNVSFGFRPSSLCFKYNNNKVFKHIVNLSVNWKQDRPAILIERHSLTNPIDVGRIGELKTVDTDSEADSDTSCAAEAIDPCGESSGRAMCCLSG